VFETRMLLRASVRLTQSPMTVRLTHSRTPSEGVGDAISRCRCTCSS
jgi:hypothetical protein